MIRLYIVRHGNTFDAGETVRRVGARTDLHLSTSGWVQAKALGQHFAGLGIVFDAVYASPLRRTQQTAAAICSATATRSPLTYSAHLTEIDYGPDEGKPEAEIVARLGQNALAKWEAENIAPEGWQVSPADLRGGWRALIASLSTEHEGGNVLAVTSNGVARFALEVIEAGSDDLAGKLRTGSYGCIRVDKGGEARLEGWDIRPEG